MFRLHTKKAPHRGANHTQNYCGQKSSLEVVCSNKPWPHAF